MALGTITKPTALGSAADYTVANKRSRTRDVQITSGANYTTGGETITAASVGLRSQIHQVVMDGNARTTTGGASSLALAIDYSPTDGSVKLQAYRYDGASAGKAFLEEVAANVDLSTFSARLTFIGR